MMHKRPGHALGFGRAPRAPPRASLAPPRPRLASRVPGIALASRPGPLVGPRHLLTSPFLGVPPLPGACAATAVGRLRRLTSSRVPPPRHSTRAWTHTHARTNTHTHRRTHARAR